MAKKFRTRKLAYIPTDFEKIVQAEINKIKQERKMDTEPTQIEAWDRLANKLMKQLVLKKRRFKIR